MSRFIHLHNHSHFSLLDSTVTIDQYIEEAKKQGMAHLGLTDHGNLFGTYEFFESCQRAKINPVLGMEAYVSTSEGKYYHLCLYCKNEIGYKNLIALATLGYTRGFQKKPLIRKGVLEKHSNGLIATSACISGEIPSLILQGEYEKALEATANYKSLFGDDFYLEIQDHGFPDEKTAMVGLISLSRELQIPLVATNDIHFLRKEHATAHDTLYRIGKRESTVRKNRYEEFYFKSESEMRQLFAHCPEALDNTVKLAEKCDLSLPSPGPIIPGFPIPESYSNTKSYLTHLVYRGLEERFGKVTQEIRTRANYEIQAIYEMEPDFLRYLLIVWDYVDWAKAHDIPVGPGRGSAPGSLIVFALGITDLDPLLYNLSFERFFNPERLCMIDIDVDFGPDRHEEVINYLTQKYGASKVLGACEFTSFSIKNALVTVAETLPLEMKVVFEIVQVLPDSPPPRNWKKSHMEYYLEYLPQLKEYAARDEVYQDLFHRTALLEGLNCSINVPDRNRLIGVTDITQTVPLYIDLESGTTASQYALWDNEKMGLMSLDLFKREILDQMKEFESSIRELEPGFTLAGIPMEDKKTFKMLSQGDNESLYQFNSRVEKRLLMDGKPECMEDLIALHALSHPQFMKFIQSYLDNRYNKDSIHYTIPELEGILSPTYGFILYQEQIIQIIQRTSGFTAGKADLFRRALARRKVRDIDIFKWEFIEGAAEQDREEEDISRILTMLEASVESAVNKSHSAASALIIYRLAYIKANYSGRI